MARKRTILIGLDGVPYGLVDELANRGVMPNFQMLKKQGIFAKMAAPLPAISSVSWSSIITGQNPGQHGIFGFVDLAPSSYDLVFPNFNDLQAPAFWQKYPQLKQVVLNVPSTYPVKPMNGVHISGFVSPDIEQAIFPAQYLPRLREMKYEIDVDSDLAHQNLDLFLENLFQTTQGRIEACRYFWKEIDWDIFWLVFTGSDRLGHFLFDAYRNENHRYHQDFLRYFQRVDEVIGEVAEQLSPEDGLLIFSDHGMTEVKANFNINYFLQENGFLTLAPLEARPLTGLDKSPVEFYNQISPKTRAFALEPGRIYINKKGKYPRGNVEEKDKEKILSDLIAAFSRVELLGERMIERVFRKEEIYSGSEVGKAPDLVLVEKPGFRLRAGLNKKELFDKDIFTGTHTGDDAFLLVKAPRGIEVPQKDFRVEDLIGIIEKYFSEKRV